METSGVPVPESVRPDAPPWRELALHGWADAAERAIVVDDAADDEVTRLRGEIEHLRAELARLQATASWRVTRPLRGARRLVARAARRG